MRTNLLKVCNEAIKMEEYWSKHFVGSSISYESSEYKGRMEQKEEECTSLVSEMKGLMT